jgi:hypothetical protein
MISTHQSHGDAHESSAARKVDQDSVLRAHQFV